MLFEFIGSPTFWGLLTVLLSVIIFSYVLESHEASAIIGSVVLLWVSLSRLIPVWIGVTIVVIYSFLLGFGIISFFTPKTSQGGGSDG